MISLRRLGVILAHEGRLIRRDPFPILVLVVFPIIDMAFLEAAFRATLVQSGHPHANGAEQVVPGQAAMMAFFVVSLVVFAFFSEFTWGTWDRLRASPARSIEIVLGKAIPRLAMVLAQFVVVFFAGIVIFDLHIRGDAIALVPLVAAFSFCLVLLGVAVTAFFRTAQQAGSFASAGMVLFGAIGGALVPISVLPDWARTVAPVVPTYWVMRGFGSVILDGKGFGGIVMPVCVLLGMGAVCAVAALRRMRFDETKVAWV
jgi:ABC-2 type transport system permease protein